MAIVSLHAMIDFLPNHAQPCMFVEAGFPGEAFPAPKWERLLTEPELDVWLRGLQLGMPDQPGSART